VNPDVRLVLFRLQVLISAVIINLDRMARFGDRRDVLLHRLEELIATRARIDVLDRLLIRIVIIRVNIIAVNPDLRYEVVRKNIAADLIVAVNVVSIAVVCLVLMVSVGIPAMSDRGDVIIPATGSGDLSTCLWSVRHQRRVEFESQHSDFLRLKKVRMLKFFLSFLMMLLKGFIGLTRRYCFTCKTVSRDRQQSLFILLSL
jgi:hypothetical protein